MLAKNTNIGSRPEIVEELMKENSVIEVRFTGGRELCVHLQKNAPIGRNSTVTKMLERRGYSLDEVYPSDNTENGLDVYFVHEGDEQ